MSVIWSSSAWSSARTNRQRYGEMLSCCFEVWCFTTNKFYHVKSHGVICSTTSCYLLQSVTQKSCCSQAERALASTLISGLEKKSLAPFEAASWCERPYVWLVCCYMMKTMTQMRKPPSEDLQSGIIHFITAALPSLVVPRVCRFSLAGSAWSLSGPVRQKNVCTTQIQPSAPNPPPPARLPPSLPPLSPSYVNLLDDPQALWFSIHQLIRRLRKRQTQSAPPLPEHLKGPSLIFPPPQQLRPPLQKPPGSFLFPLFCRGLHWGQRVKLGGMAGGGDGVENVPSLLSGLGGVLPH